MAINLATKYSDKVVDKFYQESLIAGKSSREYSWDGVKSIQVQTITTVEPGDYSRTGTSRYGTPTEVQDTQQLLTLTQDKSVALTIDKGNNTEQMQIKAAGKVLALEMREQFIPMIDKYAFTKWVAGAGVTAKDGTLTKSNIVEKIFAANASFINNSVPMNEVYLYIPASKYNMVRLSPEFVGVDNLAEKILTKGVVGEIAGFKVVPTPDAYFASTVNFLVCNKNSVLCPLKLEDAHIKQDPPGISGHLLEIRKIYDAFVLETKNKGVYVSTTATA